MEERAFFLGCPMWAHPPWVGRFYRADAKRGDFLRQYSSVFGAVEGNSTFYGLPSAETVARWTVDAPDGFRFCFKFPKAVTHERRLIDAEDDTGEFLERLAPLGTRLGPMLIQLPAAFSPARLGALDGFLSALPRRLQYAVEVRHREFFADGPAERDLDALLRVRGANRVLFDTTGLFTTKPADGENIVEALRKKPQVPRRTTVTGISPIVRFVGDPVLARSQAALEAWASQLDTWLSGGLSPFFFAHHADDTFAPDVARILHSAIARMRPELGPLPAWPCEREQSGADTDEPDGQTTLFA